MADVRRDWRRGRAAGMSLMEVMVVVAIIALVAFLAVPRVMGYNDRAKVEAAAAQLRNLQAALDVYRLDTGGFPSEEEGLKALIERPRSVEAWFGPYLTASDALSDPWGAPYLYEYPQGALLPVVTSFGADQRKGGDGLAADLSQ